MNIKDIIKGPQGLSLPLLTRQEMIKSKINRTLYLTVLGFSSCVNQYPTKGKISPQQYMLIYCVEGLGFIDLGNSKYELSQDEFIIFPEGISNFFFTSFTDPWRIYWVGFNGELADDLFKRGSSNSGVMARKVNYDENRLTEFNRIYRLLSQSYTSDDLELANFQLTYFITSLIYDNRIKSSRSDEDPINASVIFMKKNIGNRLTIEDLARNRQISSSCYAAIFKAQTYESPINYYNQLKIQKAAQYLVSTGRSIKSISLELGFADQYYFSRLFSKIIGIPPSQYKQSIITQVRGMNCSSASI